MNNEIVQEWLRVHRALLDREARFTTLALKAAEGELSLQQLQEERALLEAERDLCAAAYRRAFPGATPSA